MVYKASEAVLATRQAGQLLGAPGQYGALERQTLQYAKLTMTVEET